MNLYQYRTKFESLFKKDLETQLETIINIDLEKQNKIQHNQLPINENEFYYSKSIVQLWSINKEVHGKVEKNNYKNVYLSYSDKNNNFSEEPQKSLVDIEHIKNYYFNVNTEVSDTVQIVPFVIHYSKGEKIKLTRLVEEEQLVVFGEEEDKCRLTFKLIGHGNFCIKSVSIYS